MPGYKIKFDIVGESPHESTFVKLPKKECRTAFCSVFSVNVDVKFPHVKVKLKGNGLYLLRILFDIGFFPSHCIVIPIISS